MDEKLKSIINADRRLVFLRLLASDPDYASNGYVIKEALAAMGHQISFDQMHTDAAWLAEQGLITVTWPKAELCVCKLTMRGKEAAAGTINVPGVKKPEPGLDY